MRTLSKVSFIATGFATLLFYGLIVLRPIEAQEKIVDLESLGVSRGFSDRHDYSELLERARKQSPASIPIPLSEIKYRSSQQFVNELDGRVSIQFEDGTSFEPSWSRFQAGRRKSERDAEPSIARQMSAPSNYTSTTCPPAQAATGDVCITPAPNAEQVIVTSPLTSLGYDYAPSVMFDDGVYKIWWCAHNGNYGDRINYVEATDIKNPATYSAPLQVFGGRHLDPGNQPSNCTLNSDFDCAQTCDPSVVKVGSTYFMFYTGFTIGEDYSATGRTEVGLAISPDGLTWNRVDGDPSTPGVIDAVVKAANSSVFVVDDVFDEGDIVKSCVWRVESGGGFLERESVLVSGFLEHVG